MNTPPERIKAWVTRNGVTEWEAGSLQFPPDTEVEYVRADLHEAEIAAVYEAAADAIDELALVELDDRVGGALMGAANLVRSLHASPPFACADLAAPKVKPLQCVELRNNNWQMGPYQIRFSKPGVWRITFYGKIVCHQIKGYDAAKAWVQKDHERRVLDALE